MRGMIPSDIGLLRQATAVQLSPDGSSVAFTVVSVDLDANEYRSRIWLGPTDGSTRPRPFTSGQARDGLPRWSPDGRVLAFVSHREDKGSQVLVIPVTVSGETVVVSSWPEEVTELAWSPDGERLAFVARDRDDARQLAYLRNPTPMDEPRHNQVGVINVDSCERLELTTWLDRNCAPFPGARSPVWHGDHLVFAVEDAGNVHLYRVPADGTGKPEVVLGGDRCVAAWDSAAGAVAFASTTPTTVAE